MTSALSKSARDPGRTFCSSTAPSGPPPARCPRRCPRRAPGRPSRTARPRCAAPSTSAPPARAAPARGTARPRRRARRRVRDDAPVARAARPRVVPHAAALDARAPVAPTVASGGVEPAEPQPAPGRRAQRGREVARVREQELMVAAAAAVALGDLVREARAARSRVLRARRARLPCRRSGSAASRELLARERGRAAVGVAARRGGLAAATSATAVERRDGDAAPRPSPSARAERAAEGAVVVARRRPRRGGPRRVVLGAAGPRPRPRARGRRPKARPRRPPPPAPPARAPPRRRPRRCRHARERARRVRGARVRGRRRRGRGRQARRSRTPSRRATVVGQSKT